jgi:hypothetical protein
MNAVTRGALATVTLALLGLGFPSHGAESIPPFSHDAFARVLRDHVQNARVDYHALKARPADLDTYLDQVAAVDPTAFTQWPRPDRLALLINLYNARTLRLIADHYPVASIRKIGLLPGAAWRMKVVRWGGTTISLDDLEHGILRKDYQEPRIHFALVCAAKGCPPLRTEPFLPDRLDAQLQDQARRFLADTAKNRLDSGTRTLWLSPIFDWFTPDFTDGGKRLTDYVMPLLPDSTRTALATLGDVQVRFTDYDWSLNDQAAP